MPSGERPIGVRAANIYREDELRRGGEGKNPLHVSRGSGRRCVQYVSTQRTFTGKTNSADGARERIRFMPRVEAVVDTHYATSRAFNKYPRSARVPGRRIPPTVRGKEPASCLAWKRSSMHIIP